MALIHVRDDGLRRVRTYAPNNEEAEDGRTLLFAFENADGERLVLKHMAKRLEWSMRRTSKARAWLRNNRHIVEEYAGPGNTVWFIFPTVGKAWEQKNYIYAFMAKYLMDQDRERRS